MTAPVALLIEDEPQIRRFVRAALESEGYVVHETDSVARGLIEAGTRHPDLVVLDLGLPDGDGVTVVRELRAWSTVPVLVLSARTLESAKVAALDAGADDYLVKPFGMPELLARARALLRRRHATRDAPVVRFGAVEVDLAARVVRRAGAEVHLTPTEYRVLTALLAHAGRVVTQRQLLRDVWGPSHGEDGHYLRVYMGHLRRKLEADPARPVHLLTETGVGYRFVPGDD
jgi:two-component system KDP operon response regulator KdpE